jgi:hypothetical protein
MPRFAANVLACNQGIAYIIPFYLCRNLQTQKITCQQSDVAGS